MDLIEKGEWGTLKKDIAEVENVKGADNVFKKQTLESLTPGILEPSFPNKLEKTKKKVTKPANRANHIKLKRFILRSK